ncbi:hypothetical protein NPIL_624621 [Nephila pilipes]|uniref:Uncharacterized protein n=1 Tax=Nephila pilipes TaxID=299642 RepID=A0A8X6QUN9_NEPPI|nr:hypothetical protein NPIL_624621 [Nephila pilipes]
MRTADNDTHQTRPNYFPHFHTNTDGYIYHNGIAGKPGHSPKFQSVSNFHSNYCDTYNLVPSAVNRVVIHQYALKVCKISLATKEAMQFFENLTSNFSDISVVFSSDEVMSNDYPSLVFSSGFENAERDDNSSDEDLKNQSVQGDKKKFFNITLQRCLIPLQNEGGNGTETCEMWRHAEV